MSEDGFEGLPGLSEARLAVIGLGLMGGSLALALRGHCVSLAGFDPDPRVLCLALQEHVVDRASPDLSEILLGTDLIILSAPVLAIPEVLKSLDQFHPSPAVVLDLGSTKTQIVAAMADLPERFDPLGGHPMCGKEKASLANADARLYNEAVFALVPLPRTSDWAKGMVLDLVATIGSRPLWLEAAEHDRWVAATSHLPYLLANALTLATPGEAAPLAGPGFLSTSRLAGSYTPMMLDVLQTNRQNILHALQEFRTRLEDFERCVEGEDFETLANLLQESARKHEIFSSRGV